MKIRSI